MPWLPRDAGGVGRASTCRPAAAREDPRARGATQPLLAQLLQAPVLGSSRSPRPPRSKGTGRKQGGQPGHQGKMRPWFPLDDVDEFVDVRPSHCGCRARPLRPAAVAGLAPWRHQVVEFPPVSAFVTEYLMHGAVCDACGERTQASLPEGVMPWAVGPRLQAVLSTLSGRFRLSRREVLEAAEALFGPKARLGLGTLVALEERTRRALTAAYEEAARAVQEASIVHPDAPRTTRARTRAGYGLPPRPRWPATGSILGEGGRPSIACSRTSRAPSWSIAGTPTRAILRVSVNSAGRT